MLFMEVTRVRMLNVDAKELCYCSSLPVKKKLGLLGIAVVCLSAYQG